MSWALTNGIVSHYSLAVVLWRNVFFSVVILGFCAVVAAGKRTAAISVCCQPHNWITLVFYPSLFPACNEINATLICITLLLSLRLQNEWGTVWLRDMPEKQHSGLENHGLCALTDFQMDGMNYLAGILKLLKMFGQTLFVSNLTQQPWFHHMSISFWDGRINPVEGSDIWLCLLVYEISSLAGDPLNRLVY